MKNKLILSTFAMLFTMASVQARTASAQFLYQGFGAKAVGLGKAYGVKVDDPSALYWNPAGLASIDGERKTIQKISKPTDAAKTLNDEEDFSKLLEEQSNPESEEKSLEITERTFETQLNTSVGLLSQGRQMGFAGLGITAFGGTLGAGALGTRVTDIEGYDSTGTSTGSLAYNAMAGYLGFAKQSGPVRLGVSGFAVREDIGGAAVNGGGMNFGAQVVPIPIIAVGVDIKNLGAIQARPGSNSYEKLDTLMHFAIAVTTPPPNSNIKIILGFTSNLDETEENATRLNMGLAYGLNSYSYIMAGLDGSRPALGFGINFKKYFQFSYSVNRDTLGTDFQHFAELNMAF